MLVAVFFKNIFIYNLYVYIYIYLFTLCVHYNVQCLHTIFGYVFLTQPDLLEKVRWAAHSACCFALRALMRRLAAFVVIGRSRQSRSLNDPAHL